MNNKKAYVWIQNNCRLHDNPALHFRASSSNVEFISIIDPKLSSRAPVFYQFYLECLKELEKNLKQAITLYYKDTFTVLNDLLSLNNNDVLVTHAQYTDWEIETEQRLIKKFGERIFIFECETLIKYEPVQLPIHFTEFRKKVEPRLVFKELESYSENSKALVHLENYIWQKKLPLTYKETRNGLIGEDYSTKFSKYLAVGALSAQLIFNEIKRFEKVHGESESTYWIIFELLWRDFFKLQARKQKSLFFLKHGYNHKKANQSQHNSTKFAAWCEGKTANNFINAFMIQLKSTGYMSNRGRQIVASFLVHDLQCDWRAGASYFESKLIDFDPALNWGNWAYIAGVGSDPRPSRTFNTDKQQATYDPNREFINFWLMRG